MAEKKYKFTQLQQDGTLLELHPETDADIVNVEKGASGYQGQADNVQDALKEVYDMAQNGGVTGVKGAAETTYRTGDVNLTPANIGAQAAFQDGSATIATESNGVVTIKHGVAQTAGAVGNDNGSDIVLGTAAKKGVATVIDANSTDNDLATAKAVNDKINALPEPMIFKGSLGTGGTITDLPAASASNNGFTYKVITAGTYAGQAADVGDVFTSDGTDWVLFPSGDEPSGTVMSIGAQGASGSHVTVTGGPITDSGILTVGVESGYSIPSDTKQGQWDAKYDKPGTGVPKTDLAEGVQGSLGKADTAYQKPQNGIPSADLANSGISAGTYSVVTVNDKGQATAGAQILEVGTTGQTTPSGSLAVGGLFFKEI